MKPHGNNISKEEFLKLKEEDVMFITNPGRMGDEDGSTFVVKKENQFITYRVEGWFVPTEHVNKKEFISLDDVLKQFPKWSEAWKNSGNLEYQGKYQFLYMGFGNGLCVDHSIYREYEPYLKKKVEEYLENCEEEKRAELQYAAIFNVWEDALAEMINAKKYQKR